MTGLSALGYCIVGYAAPLSKVHLRVLVIFGSLDLLLLLLLSLLLPLLLSASGLLGHHVTELVGMAENVGLVILRLVLPCWPLEQRASLWRGCTRSGFRHASGRIMSVGLHAWSCSMWYVVCGMRYTVCSIRCAVAVCRLSYRVRSWLRGNQRCGQVGAASYAWSRFSCLTLVACRLPLAACRVGERKKAGPCTLPHHPTSPSSRHDTCGVVRFISHQPVM